MRVRLKSFYGISVLLLTSLDRVGAGDLKLPPFYVSVETNDFPNAPKEKAHLSVSVHVFNRGEAAEKERVSVEMNCFAFDAGVRRFNDVDQKLFLEAIGAAKESKEFAKTIMSPAINPRKIETRFESTQRDGVWLVKVARAGDVATFEPEEGDRLVTALKEAKAGKAWFESLLADSDMPGPNEEQHRPRSRGYYVDSKVGEVTGGDLVYRVSVFCTSFNSVPTYSTQHGIEFQKKGEVVGSSSGKWVEALLEQISRGLDSLKHNTEYDYIADDRQYRVQSNLQTGKVDVTISRGDFFTDRTPVIGHFGEAELKQIRDLIAQAPARESWFREHEALFFQSSD